MPDLLELQQQDFRDLDRVADAFLGVGAALEEVDPPGIPAAFRKQFAELAEKTVEVTLGFAARLRPRWEQYKQAGWTGHAEQVHAQRDSLLHSLEARMRYLGQAIRIASLASVLTGREVPGSERLPAAIQDLATLKTEIFGRWHTLEDLQQILVETYPFTAEQFDSVAAHHRPPQEWFEQKDQPL